MPTDHPILWTLRSIARIERKGDLRPPRLTEPGLTRWNRVRRKLDFVDLVALLHEDLADAFPYPFDLTRWAANPLAGLDDAAARTLIDAALADDNSPPQVFLRNAARGLELPAGGNIANLPKVQPHQTALELPGSAGRIALQQAIDHGVAVHDRFTFAADTDAERLSLGLAFVEVRANAPKVWTSDEARAQLAAGARFDHVFGVPGHPAALALVGQAFVGSPSPGATMEVRWS
jgi:hypothetical protein